ncbi:hypothetical protein ACIOUE_37960 [Streptomyces xanthochromogenes]|uniref:hypothetical protein n=1 Tax=Streptomyces xanthochromogenes TaxID=67384 RepID=UPI003811887B
MSVRITEVGSQGVTIRWEKDDDPHGLLWQALTGSAPLEDVLAAIADPMEFANTDRLDDADDAKHRLRSVLWALKELTDRADVLTVALKDNYGQSWTEIQQVLDPENPQARSTARRRYDTGRKRIGIPAPAAVPLPGHRFTRGQRVRVIAVPDALSPDYLGSQGVVQEFNVIERSYIVTGLTGRPHQEQVLGIPGFLDQHLESLDGTSDTDPGTP